MRGQNKRIAQVQMQVLRLMSCAVPDDRKEVPTLWYTGQKREPSDSYIVYLLKVNVDATELCFQELTEHGNCRIL
uniref:Uncharacterized protein n=2 Tax=Aegilops tauschii subsp. strangulata TaxID=200361 RepID=A0A453NAT8_AEGTS